MFLEGAPGAIWDDPNGYTELCCAKCAVTVSQARGIQIVTPPPPDNGKIIDQVNAQMRDWHGDEWQDIASPERADELMTPRQRRYAAKYSQ